MVRAFCQGNEIYLRPVKLADAAVLAKWKSDPFVQRMALDSDADNISAAKEEEDVRRALDSGDQLYLIVVVRDTRQPIGYVRINWMDSFQRIAWLRFALGEHRGEGYAKDALKHFLRRLFAQGAHRVEAEVYEFNEACLHLLESLGFNQEGVKRQAHFDGDGYCDIIALGLLAEEFEPHSLRGSET